MSNNHLPIRPRTVKYWVTFSVYYDPIPWNSISRSTGKESGISDMIQTVFMQGGGMVMTMMMYYGNVRSA